MQCLFPLHLDTQSALVRLPYFELAGAGLILQCPFTSIKAVVAHLVGEAGWFCSVSFVPLPFLPNDCTPAFVSSVTGRVGAWAINDRFNNLER